MKKAWLTTVISASVLITACATTVSPDSIANSLKEVSLYDHDGWGGTPQAWKIQQQLDQAASNDWLYNAATTHHNPAARAASFYLLSRRNDPRCGELLLTTLADTGRITVICFDVWSGSSVANYNVDHFQYHNKALPVDSTRLDSTLIFTPGMGHINRLQRILSELPAEQRYYQRIRSMAYNEGITTALYALMRYRQDDDKAIVTEALREYAMGLNERHVHCGKEGRTNDALAAVAIWPDSDFWQPLTEVCAYESTRTHFDYPRIYLMYAALMAYDDQRSLALIEKMLSEASESLRQYHIEGFNRAFKKSPRPRYEAIARHYPCDSPF